MNALVKQKMGYSNGSFTWDGDQIAFELTSDIVQLCVTDEPRAFPRTN